MNHLDYLQFNPKYKMMQENSCILERMSEILIDLRCKKMKDFIWYKDLFISKIFSITDYNHLY